LQDPSSYKEAGPPGQKIKKAQGSEGDQDAQGAGSLQPNIQPVEDKGDQQDVYKILPEHTGKDFFQISKHRSPLKTFCYDNIKGERNLLFNLPLREKGKGSPDRSQAQPGFAGGVRFNQGG
jgi:hypothetical protein